MRLEDKLLQYDEDGTIILHMFPIRTFFEYHPAMQLSLKTTFGGLVKEIEDTPIIIPDTHYPSTIHSEEFIELPPNTKDFFLKEEGTPQLLYQICELLTSLAPNYPTPKDLNITPSLSTIETMKALNAEGYTEAQSILEMINTTNNLPQRWLDKYKE